MDEMAKFHMPVAPPKKKLQDALPSRIRVRRSGSEAERPMTMNMTGRSYEDLTRRYEIGEELGRGISGATRVCWEYETGMPYACKTIEKKLLLTPEYVTAVQVEVAALELLEDQEEVVLLEEVVEDPKAVHIVMELCEGGDMFTRLQEVGRYPEKAAALVTKRIADALVVFKSAGLVHRDLKLENIFLTSEQLANIRIGDFGVAAFLNAGEKLTTLTGSPYYMAPEVLHCYYGHEVDVWSAGVILFMLLCGYPPFFDHTNEGIFEKILIGEIDMSSGPWRTISSAAKDLVLRMLCMDPAERILPEEVLEHPWILKHTSTSASPVTTPPVTTPSHSRNNSRCSIDFDLSAEFSQNFSELTV